LARIKQQRQLRQRNLFPVRRTFGSRQVLPESDVAQMPKPRQAPRMTDPEGIRADQYRPPMLAKAASISGDVVISGIGHLSALGVGFTSL